MKKQIRLVSLAAAALLAIAPAVASTAINVEFTLDGQKETVSPNGLYFQVLPNSSFDPLDFKGSNGSEFKISTGKNSKITVDSNSVDTSKEGSTGIVKLTSTDATGKTTTAIYNVFVKPQGLFKLNLPSSYVVGLGDTDTVYQGQQYYITNNVKFARGEFFTGISNQSQNAAATSNSVKWIATKYLANSKTTTSPAETKTSDLTVMHTALLYDENGKSLGEKYYAYRAVTVNQSPVTINGSKFYKLADRDAYIKVTNISGQGRVLKHNAYIYSTSTRRTTHKGAWKLYKGSTVTTYGGSYKFKNGKRYYRIGGPAKQYVRTSNFN